MWSAFVLAALVAGGQAAALTEKEMEKARDAIRPEAVRERIEKYRKGELVIRVLDPAGRPAAGATVRVCMRRHAFLFGCNLFGLQPASQDPALRAYQDRFAALFNYATLPFYWGEYEPERGKPRAERLIAMARWCRERGIAAKGHPLVWQEVWPKWAPGGAESAIPLLKQRVTEIIQRFSPGIRYWDVQNEANSAAQYPATGIGDWVRRDGAAAVVRETLRWARDAARQVKGGPPILLYNDYDTGAKNEVLLESLRQSGSLPDVIGIQSHMHSGDWPLEKVWTVAERFARFGRPLHFTETTVLSGVRKPVDYTRPPAEWPGTPEDEQRQAEYGVAFYSLLFSHPKVRAITWWDFSDRGAWLNAPAGLLRSDMSPKPLYYRLMGLIHRQWRTDITATADSRGEARVRAFYGTYRLVARKNGRATEYALDFPLDAGSRKVTLRLR